MIITSSGRIRLDGAFIPIHIDLTNVTYVRLDNDGSDDCVLFYSADVGGHTLPFMPKTSLTICARGKDIIPALSPDDWFRVRQIYANDTDGCDCYIHLQDIYAYLRYPVDETYDKETVGLWGTFGNMRVLLEALPAVEAEFERRRVS